MGTGRTSGNTMLRDKSTHSQCQLPGLELNSLSSARILRASTSWTVWESNKSPSSAGCSEASLFGFLFSRPLLMPIPWRGRSGGAGTTQPVEFPYSRTASQGRVRLSWGSFLSMSGFLRLRSNQRCGSVAQPKSKAWIFPRDQDSKPGTPGTGRETGTIPLKPGF